MQELSWSHEEFICFVLIYISNSDLDFSENEKDNIVNLHGADTFNKMNLLFDEMNEFQSLNAILSYKKIYFNNEEDIAKLMNNIKTHFEVDGYSDMDKDVFNFLDKLVKSDGF